MKKLTHFLIILATLFFTSCREKTTYLSSLHAGKDFPIYTTYAAVQQRSDFILDEGYEFKYDHDSLGADFTTDTGGELCLGFLKNGKWVYRVADIYKPPVITSTYPDMVQYEYEPFEYIKVKAVFMTYSSLMALVDVSVSNTGAREAELEVVPFMRSNTRGFHAISLKPGESMIEFAHEEYPDSWTIDHKLPYADSLRNILMLSSPVSESFAFTSEKGESPVFPSSLYMNRKPARQLTGRLYAPTGERLAGTSPMNRLQLSLNNNDELMVTENSSIWGSSQASLEPGGYFMIEGGSIDPKAKTYRLSGYNEKTGLQARVSGNFKTESARCDLKLISSDVPVINNLELRNNRLNWLSPGNGISYSVYRRCYPQDVYHRIAQDLNAAEFTDTSVEANKIYGYVVICTKNRVSGMHSREVINIPDQSFMQYISQGIIPDGVPANARIISFRKKMVLSSGSSGNFRLVRSVFPQNDNREKALLATRQLLHTDIRSYLQANEKLLENVKTFPLKTEKQQVLFWNNVNMMRQVFYPPQGKSAYNYYVFSREPTWGWGHGGQVFHESIAMLAYADVDPQGAMNSQRVYHQRQYPSGYINYRTGSYLDEIIEENGELTSSAPWYSFLNWEVYKMTRDKAFLKEMYGSSVKFYNFYTSRRDKDHDGLCEWGGEAILESVRDALVAIWDQVGYPSNFEALDLNCMLVMEAKSLEAMALELGLNAEADKWKLDYQKRTVLINKCCWDPKTGFYYNVNKGDHSFTFKKTNDLKRMEIIGFLPLWAGVADKEQAAALLKHLTDPKQFWRKYGVPSLSADDPYFNDKGYWNGPVWVQWNYLIERGLLDYGYPKEAAQLVGKVSDVMVDRLSKDHNLWEFYSPDNLWGGYHKTYIWAGIINRMMKDLVTRK